MNAKCKIEICSKLATATNIYCSKHVAQWARFRRRNVPQAKFEELMYATHCEVCNVYHSNLYVDHDHSHCGPKEWCSKCIRGMVCPRCNAFLAALDSPGWVKRGMAYLELHTAGDR